MPTCRHCKQVFRKWAGLKGHVLNACPVLQSRQPPNQERADGRHHNSEPPAERDPASLPDEPNQSATPPAAPAPCSQQTPNGTEDPTLRAIANVQEHTDAALADWVSFAETLGSQLKDTCIFCTQWCGKGGGV